MIRACVRLTLVAVWCLLVVPLIVLASIVTLGRPAGQMRTGPFLLYGFSRGLCAILGVRVRARGAGPPAGAAFVAPNHWGYLDVFVLGGLYRGLFVSRADVAGWPIFGYLAKSGGTLFIDREARKDPARVGDEIERRLRLGCRVTAFLEGGAGPGTSVAAFKSSLAEAAAATGARCVPVAIRYALPDSPGEDPVAVVAWNDGSFLGHVSRLARHRRIEADVEFLPPRVGTDRKELARALEGDVREALDRSRA
jgi:1-acyl-sn-glycerol-3-phosphate acyltransferase